MNDSDFQVAIVLIIFDLFEYTKNVILAHTQKSQSQSQKLIPLSRVSVSVSTFETEFIKSQSQSQSKKSGLAHP